MPLVKSGSRAAVGENIRREQAAGKPHKQAIAIALDVQRRSMAIGGQPPATPWFVRQEARQAFHPGGFLSGTGGGRADTVKTSVPAGSHIIPADVVAGLGQGNSMAGAKVMERMLSTGPFGMALGKGHARMPHLAAGGAVPVQLSDGEYAVPPHKVAIWGEGDQKKGHDRIDAFIKAVRSHTVKTIRKLPPPKK